MKAKTKVTGGQAVIAHIRELREKFARKNSVLVGVPKGKGSYEDGTKIAVIAAVHEFGGKIKHPGGTSYGYMTEEDAREGRVRFLPKGQGFMELGKTQPHAIGMPERSFLRVPLRADQKKFASTFSKSIPDVVRGTLTMEQMLERVGAQGAATVQEAISAGIDPANAPSTVERKGSSTPLMGETGNLRGSITYVIEGEEGA